MMPQTGLYLNLYLRREYMQFQPLSQIRCWYSVGEALTCGMDALELLDTMRLARD